MDPDKLSPEVEKLLKQVKLKEPPQDLMADYVAGVRAKINQQSGGPHFGFPHAAFILALGLAFAGSVYLISMRPLNYDEVPVIETQEQKASELVAAQSQTNVPETDQNTNIPVQERELSIEEELALLEVFEGEFLDEEGVILGSEDLFEELAFLDELEISSPSSIQPAVV
jgi:hypothetical protein